MNGWLIALSVVGGVLLFLILLICLGFAGAHVCYENGLTVRVSAFGFGKTIYPKKGDEPPLRDVAGANPERLLKAEEKRRRRAEKKEARRLKRAAKSKQTPKKQAAEPTPNPKENLDMILAILKRAYALTKGKVRVEFRKLHLHIATGDAASTAILDGVAVQSATYLLQWTQDHFNEIRRRDGDMTVEPDFLSRISSIELDLRLRVRAFRAIGIGLGLLRTYRVEKRRAKLRAKKRAIKQAEQKTT